MKSKFVYGFGMFAAIALFLGNVTVVEMNLPLSRPLYLLLSFGYILGFLIAMFGAIFHQRNSETNKNAWKLGILLFVIVVAVRQYYMLFEQSENVTRVIPALYGVLAFVIIAGILVLFWVMAQKLQGKSGRARFGIELQLGALVFFALAATLTCSLGALSADPDGITLTNKVITLTNSELKSGVQLITHREYGTMISYQVIGSWVAAVGLMLAGNIVEVKART